MFEKLKQIKELRDLQKSMQNQRIELEDQGIKVVINGTMKIEQLVLNAELDHASQARAVKDLINKAIEKLQKDIASSLKLF